MSRGSGSKVVSDRAGRRALLVLLAGLWAAGSWAAEAPAWPLNDTGIDWCADSGNNRLTCPVTGYPGQDAEYGRDETRDNDADGHAGFSFTKLDAAGNPLPASAASWSCVRDAVTGLVWEVKTDNGGLRDKDWTYSWYDPDPATNGGFAGRPDYDNNCYDSARCDTQKFAADVNAAGLCGASDWRLPAREELRSIVDYSRYDPAIDTAYFPDIGSNGWYWYWSSSPYASSANYAWYVYFGLGYDGYGSKNDGRPVRLVRGGRALPSGPTTLVFDPIGSVQTEGEPFPVTIRARDRLGAPVSLNESAQISSAAGEVSTSSYVRLVNGTWSGQVRVYGSGGYGGDP